MICISAYPKREMLLAELESRRCEPTVVYDEKGGALVDVKDNTRRFRGILPLLKSTFYPKYDYTPPPPRQCSGAKKTPLIPMVSRPQPLIPGQQQQQRRINQVVKTYKAIVGAELGKLIDDQITTAVNQMQATKTSIRQYLSMAYRLPKDKKIHTRTRKLLKAVDKAGWIPIASQLGVSCDGSRTGTTIDFVCFDPRKGLFVLIQNKNGFKGYYDHGSGSRMASVFSKQHDSPRNQHQLQVLAERILFSRTFRINIDSVIGVVMRVTDSDVYTYPQKDWANAGTAAVSSLLLSSK